MESINAIAASFPNVRVERGTFQGFGKTHNLASSLATHDWILSIDSDEELSSDLSAEILSLNLTPKAAYSLDRRNHFQGKEIHCCAGWYPDRVTRLYHRKTAQFSDDKVHEKIVGLGIETIPLSHPLLHTPYRTVEDFIHKMQLYSTLFAEEHAGEKSSVRRALAHGFAAFLKSYFLKKGFLGGREGFVISVHNAHVTYYKYLKLAFSKESRN